MRLLSGTLIVLGVAAWLLQGNLPHLPLTVTVIEIQTALGVPLVPVLFAAGFGVLLIGTTIRTFRGRPLADVPRGARGPRRPLATPPPTPPRAPAGGGHVVALGSHPGADWRQRVMHRASDLAFEAGASLTLSLNPDEDPFVLCIGDVPPERARRTIGVLAEFIAEIPRPASVRVDFDGFKEVGAARKRLITSAFARHFPAAQFTLAPALEGLAVRFTAPDPAWDEFRPGPS